MDKDVRKAVTPLVRFSVWVGTVFDGAMKSERKASRLFLERYHAAEGMDLVGKWALELYEERDFWGDDSLFYAVCNRLRESVGLKRKEY